jgi:hypothetical protein
VVRGQRACPKNSVGAQGSGLTMRFTTPCFAGLLSAAWVRVTGVVLEGKQGGGSKERSRGEGCCRAVGCPVSP